MNSRLRKGRGINFHDAAKAKSLRDHWQPNFRTLLVITLLNRPKNGVHSIYFQTGNAILLRSYWSYTLVSLHFSSSFIPCRIFRKHARKYRHSEKFLLIEMIWVSDTSESSEIFFEKYINSPHTFILCSVHIFHFKCSLNTTEY